MSIHGTYQLDGESRCNWCGEAVNATTQREQLRATLQEVRDCLAGWMEIASKEDMRQYDIDALAKADAILNRT